MWRKAILLSLREKKTFTVFTLIYTTLIFLTSFFIDLGLEGGFGELAWYFVIIFFGTSLFLSLLYAWILVSRKRRVWATFKCIGYTNKNILVLVSGMIFFTTLIGFLIVIEVLFHYAAAIAYINQLPDLEITFNILVDLLPVIFTSGIFIFVQILAFILAYRKVLKVRPIIALKKVGE
ncbi:MAG: FtsX-like permease family protein [Promethearchaeota archaeon]|nr:MAG: FtsX-like permease family protein [Candidatus Lokiarchaeota archaeon]